MRHLVRLAACAAFLAAISSHVQAACGPGQGLGVARTVEVDATGGPVFGSITKRERERSFLGRKEAVLTFDDGPMPGITRSILDTLDRFCTKATFFSVGRMAVAYPETVRDVLRRGHTLGTHTWSHPMSLPRIGLERARDQIEAGFAAVALAAGGSIAPFFRFPGLNDSQGLVAHLEARGIATFTVDVVSNDSYIASSERLIERTLARLEAEGGGIVLFHDIKPQTARALPVILAEMKARGYAIVHLVAKTPFVPDPGYMSSVRSHVAARRPSAARSLLAFAGRDPSAPATAGADGQATAVGSPDATAQARPTEGGQEQPQQPAEAAAASSPTVILAAPTVAVSIVAASPVAAPTVAGGAPAGGIRIEAASGASVPVEAAAAVPSAAPVVAAQPAASAEPAASGDDSRRQTDAAVAAPVAPVAPIVPTVAQPQPPAVIAGHAAPQGSAGSPPRLQPQVIAGEYGPATARRRNQTSQAPVEGTRNWRDGFSERMGQAGN